MDIFISIIEFDNIFIFILTLFVILTLFYLKKRGIFLSYYSVFLRANIPLFYKHPEVYILPKIAWIPSGKRLENFYSNAFRLILAGILSIVVIGGVWFEFADELNVLLSGYFQIISTAWQIHATITGFSFVALLFYWESLSVDITVPEAIGYLSENNGVLATVYTLLISNGALGVAAIWSQIWKAKQSPTTPPQVVLGDLIIASFSFGVFMLSLAVLVGFYESLFQTLFKKGIEKSVLESFTAEMNELGSEDPKPEYENILAQISAVEYPKYHMSPNWQGTNVTADDLSISEKVITDVHIGRLRTALDELSFDEESIELRIKPGKDMNSETRLVQFENQYPETELEKFKESLLSAIKIDDD
jgi:hypothetical protein